jgi:HTH-type transcriptional regulator / antitoxin HipB
LNADIPQIHPAATPRMMVPAHWAPTTILVGIAVALGAPPYPTGDIDKISPVGYNIEIYPAGDGIMEYPILTTRQLAQALKGWRKNRNLTQAEAAGRVGMRPKTISALESEPDASTLGSLFKLLSALDLELVIRPKDKGSAGKTATGEW